MPKSAEFSLIQSFVNSDRKSIILAILASVASGASSALLVAFIGKQFVVSTPFGTTSIVYFIGLLILSVVTDLYAAKILIEASSEHSYSLRMALCRQILSTKYEQIEKIGNHRLMAILTEDLNAIAVAFTRIPILSSNVTRVFFCIGYLLWLAPLEVSIIIVLSLPVFYVQTLLFRRSKSRMREILPIRDRRFALYQSLTNGFKELALNKYWRVNFLTNKLRPNALKTKIAGQNVFMANQYAVSWGQSAYFVIIFGLLIVASRGYIGKEVVAAFALVGLFLRSSVNNLLLAIPIWMRATTAVRKINSLELSAERPDLFSSIETVAKQATSSKVNIKLTNVLFTYATDQTTNGVTIGPLDLDFTSGELVFVTGGNGSGKTTLVNLLASLYRPTAGSIQLNGQQISEENEEWYRLHIHTVFSDFSLIDGLTQNPDSLNSPQLESSLKKLRLDGDLLHDSSEDNSLKLSTGQKARLALLPVLVLDKPILIFDEWAAHQDPEFKDVFYYQLLPEMKQLGKLIVVITHDDRYFDIADRIIKLDSGRIVEDVQITKPSTNTAAER